MVSAHPCRVLLLALPFALIALIAAPRGCTGGAAGCASESPVDDTGSGGRSGEQNAGGTGPGLVRGGTLAAAWANDGGDKVARHERRAVVGRDSVLNSVWDGTRVNVFGARNEVVSFAIVLEAPDDDDVTGLSVALSDLHAPSGAKIGATSAVGDGVFDWTGREVEVFYVRYLQILGLSVGLAYDDYDERHIPERFRRPTMAFWNGFGGWSDRPDHDAFYPEIAVPIELVGEFTVHRAQSQTIWVDVYIPREAESAVYEGTFVVSEKGEVVREIPVRLGIRDFTLPDVASAKTMLFLGYETINHRYLGEKYPDADTPNATSSRKIRDRHFQLAHRHRISLIDQNSGAGANDEDRPRPEWIPRLDGSLFTAAHGYDGPGVAASNGVFSIGTYGGWSWKEEGEAAMRSHTDAWVRWFEQHAPDTETFLYLVDEPSEEKLGDVETWARWIDDNPGLGSSLKSLVTLGFPRARERTPSVDIPAALATFGIERDWQKARDALAADSDSRVYMYNGQRPASGSFAIEDDGIALRELAWAQYKKGVDRWFYWDSTYYDNYQGGTGETNVFATAQTFGGAPKPDEIRGERGWNYMNGDGVLFYPGTDRVFPEESYGVSGPLASLRLKHWRRGVQDVDYLTMAAEVDPERTRKIVDRIVPEVLWELGVSDESDPTWVRTDISWSNDPDVWEAARAELAEIIESGSEPQPAPR